MMGIKQKVLVLGATGMLGHAVFKSFFQDARYQTYGTVRSLAGLQPYFSAAERQAFVSNVDVNRFDSLLAAFSVSRPDVVINCVGIIKQLPSAHNHVTAIEMNALFPHQLANLCAAAGARLIHISTDCVFNGRRGSYTETDLSDAEDLYGKTKFLGEVSDSPAITIRTSIIGHELTSSVALIDWFLSQKDRIKGYSNVIYTGLTTYELAKVMKNVIIPDPALQGLYQIASNPISKYKLLRLYAEIYHKEIEIAEFPDVISDRSLISEKFTAATGYEAPIWPDMIRQMYEKFDEWDCYRPKFGRQYCDKTRN